VGRWAPLPISVLQPPTTFPLTRYVVLSTVQMLPFISETSDWTPARTAIRQQQQQQRQDKVFTDFTVWSRVRSINASDISSLDFVISLPRDAIHSPENRKNTLVFHSDREPPNRGVECKGVSKNRDFRPTFRCISEMVDLQDRATVTIECPQKPVPSFRMVSFSMTLNDP